MLKVQFYDQVEDEKLKFAVILAKKEGKWIFCKHRKGIPMRSLAGTGSRGRRSGRLPGGSSGRKLGLWSLR